MADRREVGVGLTVAYLRVSTEGQEEGSGLNVQRQHIVAYATANGFPVDQWFQDVESGARENRPSLAELRHLVASGKVSRVLIYRLDRLARDSFLAEGLYRELSKRAAIVSVSEGLGEGFTATLMRQIIQAFAEYERSVIASRLKGGRRETARTKGTFSGGPGVLGYRPMGTKDSSGKGELRIVDTEVEAVRTIFELREEGMKMRAIADELNHRGLRTMKGATFSATQVHRVLNREAFYRGAGVLVRSYEGNAAAHAPIIG